MRHSKRRYPVADLVLSRGFCAEHPQMRFSASDHGEMRFATDCIRKAQCVDITNCFTEDGHGGLEILPRVVPPFPVMWLEAWLQKDGRSYAHAWLATSRHYGPFHPSGAEWEVSLLRVHCRPHSCDIPHWESRLSFGLTSDGRLQERCGYAALDALRSVATVDSLNEDFEMSLALAEIPLFALSLMNCSNVRLDPVQREQKQRGPQRVGGEARLKYSTIVLPDSRSSRRGVGHSDTPTLARALHICRGHFATYSPDRPLFGRITGTVWKPAHVRGDAGRGTVEKDYIVSPK